MPVDPNFVCRFVAEPPQEPLPDGRWAATLKRHFLGACDPLNEEEDGLGEPGEIAFYPDRTWHGRTYIPATTLTSTGYELFGYVSFRPGGDDREPSEFAAVADFTPETAAENPDWELDLCEEVVGVWRGERSDSAEMTLVWGRPLVERGEAPIDHIVTVPGVAGIWWYRGAVAPEPYATDARGLQITYCYLDDDPVATATRLHGEVRRRWVSGEVEGLLAAPFHTLVPFEWTRYLPGDAAPT